MLRHAGVLSKHHLKRGIPPTIAETVLRRDNLTNQVFQLLAVLNRGRLHGLEQSGLDKPPVPLAPSVLAWTLGITDMMIHP
eukprot:4509562-Pyramimonas_sp.AAC.1